MRVLVVVPVVCLPFPLHRRRQQQQQQRYCNFYSALCHSGGKRQRQKERKGYERKPSVQFPFNKEATMCVCVGGTAHAPCNLANVFSRERVLRVDLQLAVSKQPAGQCGSQAGNPTLAQVMPQVLCRPSGRQSSLSWAPSFRDIEGSDGGAGKLGGLGVGGTINGTLSHFQLIKHQTHRHVTLGWCVYSLHFLRAAAQKCLGILSESIMLMPIYILAQYEIPLHFIGRQPRRRQQKIQKPGGKNV